MALQLGEQEAREVRLGQLDIIIDPKSEWNQTAPHVVVRLCVGNTIAGGFQKLYDRELRFEGTEFAMFISNFTDLENRFFQFLIDSGKITGTTK